MFQTTVTEGPIFYGKTRRRTSLKIDDSLRALTLKIIAATSQLFADRATPTASYEKGRCDNCSLIDLCMPHALRLKRGANSWFTTRLNDGDHQTASTGEPD